VAYRQLAMALLIKLSHMSLPAAARMFGGLNHTTCLHAKRRMPPVLDAPGLDECDPTGGCFDRFMDPQRAVMRVDCVVKRHHSQVWRSTRIRLLAKDIGTSDGKALVQEIL
jgi:hypothetical protein